MLVAYCVNFRNSAAIECATPENTWQNSCSKTRSAIDHVNREGNQALLIQIASIIIESQKGKKKAFSSIIIVYPEFPLIIENWLPVSLICDKHA